MRGRVKRAGKRWASWVVTAVGLVLGLEILGWLYSVCSWSPDGWLSRRWPWPRWWAGWQSDDAHRDSHPFPVYAAESTDDLIEEYLAPWSMLGIDRVQLDALEVPFHGAGVRIRIPHAEVASDDARTDRRILYRVLDHFPQTYRLQRLQWVLQLTWDALPLPPGTEFYVNLGDVPRAAADSSVRDEFAGAPVFSFRTSDTHLDIPVPDPAEYGSHGMYVLRADAARNVPEDDIAVSYLQPSFGDVDRSTTTGRRAFCAAWSARLDRAYFRGVTSAFVHQHGNHAADARIQLHVLAQRHADVLDAGIVEYRKFHLHTDLHTHTDNASASVDAFASGTLPPPVPRAPLSHLRRYRYVLDVDGGLGSSRKRLLLSQSGATPLFQRSPWRQWYEPLLRPYRHFLPVDRWMRDLTRQVRWARRHPHRACDIAYAARTFADAHLTYHRAVQYYRALLTAYARRLAPESTERARAQDATVANDPCALRAPLRHGPMGCWRGWHTFRGSDGDARSPSSSSSSSSSIPFGCTYQERRRPPHVCWRRLPNDTTHAHPAEDTARWRLQRKHGIDAAYTRRR
ncbi:hypothetical protein CDCA_CDCA01G0339 [Cyanidium caldarium]|uniref:Glycosyl transferase CAP10 domain-containing protein n=1 Tax=Cyanidium caldarium TaxID=2771 RepID=A0AAV9IPS1_CYACA|nr:hypothetical protein CDCA_CDCA01G0339 [Cyanidium caldarium]